MSIEESLPTPGSVQAASQKMEMLRVWIADGHQIVAISPSLWSDSGSWGLMLVDLVKHVARAYEQQGVNYDETLMRIKQAFDVEWDNPTDEE